MQGFSVKSLSGLKLRVQGLGVFGWFKVLGTSPSPSPQVGSLDPLNGPGSRIYL